MIKYEDALRIAKEHKPNIDYCNEETLAWIFSSKEDEHHIGGDGPIVIIKKTGEVLNMPTYVIENPYAKEVGEWDL